MRSFALLCCKHYFNIGMACFRDLVKRELLSQIASFHFIFEVGTIQLKWLGDENYCRQVDQTPKAPHPLTWAVELLVPIILSSDKLLNLTQVSSLKECLWGKSLKISDHACVLSCDSKWLIISLQMTQGTGQPITITLKLTKIQLVE